MSDIILLCLTFCETGITSRRAHDPPHASARVYQPHQLAYLNDTSSRQKIPAFLRAKKNPAEAGLELLRT
jgi:hypothetical protein